jgi:GNAT superfamily N-acetyltransferase
MARIRAADLRTEEAWTARISAYLAGEHHPQHALLPRVSYVALDDDAVVGYIAGHLSRRYGCSGELQWMNVIPEQRGTGVAGELLRLLAKWFVKQKALRICVNVDPANAAARHFYAKHGAERLNDQWLMWNDIRTALSSVPTLCEQNQLVIGNLLNFVAHRLCKQLIQRDFLEHGQAKDL